MADIFQAVDFDPNLFFVNQGDSTFTEEATEAGLDNAFNEMGSSLGDYDNDGDFDIYVTNIYFANSKYNLLLRNDSTPETLSFTEVALAAGVENTSWGWVLPSSTPTMTDGSIWP